MLQSIIDTILSAESIAVVVGIFIFSLAILLFVKKLINFFMTAFLLLFCLAAGLAIANYDVLKKAYVDEESKERKIILQKWESVQQMLQKVLDRIPQMEEQGDFILMVESLRTQTKAELDHLNSEIAELKTDVKAIKNKMEFFFEEKEREGVKE